MQQNTRVTYSAAPSRLPRSTLAYSAVLATALLCACGGGSSWKSNSALSNTGRPVKANPATDTGATVRSVSSAAQPTAGGTAAKSAGSTTSTPQANADAAASANKGTPEATARNATGGATGGAAAAAEPAAHATAAVGADTDHSAGMPKYGEDDGFSDEGGAAADNASAQPLAGSLAAGGASPDEAGGQDGNLAGMQGRNAATGGSDTSGARGSDPASSGGQGAGGEITAAGDAGGQDSSLSSASQAGARDSTSPTSVAAAEAPRSSAPGASEDRSTSSAGSEAANIAAAAPGGSKASSGQSEGDADSVQAALPPSGVVEAPGKQATRREEIIPQTLGGMLPLTLGIDGQGEFDFDKAVLRDQVREQLDDLAARLKVAEYDRLEIVGHTDRIGTEDYNQYLSERRAWAVARYLVDHGVPASKVRVEGRGMHEPMTPVSECSDQLSREQLIACLQLDRRVVISASIRKVDVKVQ